MAPTVIAGCADWAEVGCTRAVNAWSIHWAWERAHQGSMLGDTRARALIIGDLVGVLNKAWNFSA